MSLTYTDIFCGAGGSSIGLTEAGLELRLAANHWDRAIETHAANFRDAEHLCADVNNYDMRRLPKTDLLWASPICTENSPAGGRKRTTRQLDLLQTHGPVAPAAMDRTRATFWDVIRATEVHRYTAIIVENVVEAAAWELFDIWLAGMTTLGYTHQFVSVSSAHIGWDGNPHAPQWRDRLYIVFTANGVPLPDVRPRPVAWCPTCDQLVAAVQSWKRPDRRRIGKYAQQYLYRCPNGGTCGHAIVEPFVLPAAAAIDWTDIGTRIGDRTRPLAAATLRRIEAGLRMFTQPVGPPPCPPMLVPSGGTWNDAPSSTGQPMRTRTVRDMEALVCPPFALNTNHTGDHGRPYPVGSRPLPPRTTKIGDGLVSPIVGELRRNAGCRPAGTAPLQTLAAEGNHHYLATPPGAFYVKHFTPRGAWAQMSKDVRTNPLGSITAVDHHSLVVPYRKGQAKTTSEPLHTLATHDSAALVEPAITVEDCHFRMLQPREHLRAQRFPDSYIVTGNKSEQTMQAGNAVSANVAHWLGTAITAALDQSTPENPATKGLAA